MDPRIMRTLDKVLDDVIEVLNESGWDDEAAWYDDLRRELMSHEPGSPQFTELLIELEQSFLGLGSFADIPLSPQLHDATAEARAAAAIDTNHQRWGLASCACGVIREIKRSVD